jgi:osmoprotectant transport system ATP-binding protein
VVKSGRLVQYDRPEQILENPADPFVAAFVGADRALKRLSRFIVRPFVHTAASATIDSDLDSLLARGGPRFLWITEGDGTLLGSLDTALAARCGETRACVSAENIREMAVLPDSSLKEALSRMIGTSARSLPVVDAQFRLVGQISLSDVEEASEKQARDPRAEA